MKDYSELLAELHSLADDETHTDVFRQAAQALERIMCDQPELKADWPFPGEPSDHEAEGAMLYVMSRGKPAT